MADAKPKKGNAKVHMDKAAKAHKAGKFDVALSELQAAYEIDPQPKLLFAIGQVYAKLDDCDAAIDHYEKFSAATKEKAKQSVAKQAIDACKKRLDEKAKETVKDDKPDKGDSVFRAKKPPSDELPTADVPPDEPKVEPTPAPPPVETKPVEEPKPEPPKQIKAFDEPPPQQPPAEVTVTATSTKAPWYKDPIGDALVVTGVSAGVGSLIMYLGARSELDDAEGAGSLEQYNEHHDNAERKQVYAFVLGGAGIALLTAGVLRYKLRSDGTESRGVAIVPTGDGGLITWSGGF